MTKQEAQDLYKGKQFFIRNPNGTLDGPREDIYYTNPYPNKSGYAFIQVIDGTPVRAFLENEIKVVQDGK
jgi:hypothetical protein